MSRALPIGVSDDLTVAIGAASVTLSPRQGLALAEMLARKSFRQALALEAAKMNHESLEEIRR
jgi:hypothetical protein